MRENWQKQTSVRAICSWEHVTGGPAHEDLMWLKPRHMFLTCRYLNNALQTKAIEHGAWHLETVCWTHHTWTRSGRDSESEADAWIFGGEQWDQFAGESRQKSIALRSQDELNSACSSVEHTVSGIPVIPGEFIRTCIVRRIPARPWNSDGLTKSS